MRAAARWSAKGNPLHVQLMPGQKNEALVARDLLEYACGRFFIGDASCESNELIDAGREQGMKAVLHPAACGASGESRGFEVDLGEHRRPPLAEFGVA